MQRILLVEDEEAVARALERLLRRHAEVRVLLDPQQLTPTLHEFKPTIVISDLHMPTKSGLDVLAEAKQVMPGAVRALLSGSLQTLPAKDLLALEPLRLIAKPWNTATLARDLGLEP